MQFYKYESLGNNFILLDWIGKTESFCSKQLNSPSWHNFVKKLCDRNFGIGADGILILKKDQNASLPISMIFNSDGSNGNVCFNGIRCIAMHLNRKHDYPSQFDVLMGNKTINCIVNDNKTITTNVGHANYLNEKTITIKNKNFPGHIVDAGNPHFVLFQKTNLKWLTQNGSLFEQHKAFPNKTNTEFIYKEKDKTYNALVYERGAGITLACSSGAAAIMQTLLIKKEIELQDIINIKMPGGNLTSWIDKNKNIYQKAKANFIFEGKLQ